MAHGVQVKEVPTGVVPAVQVTAALPVYIGTAPITSVDVTNVNKPKLCATLADFENAFGALSSDFDSWTLHEAAKAHFDVYGVAPIVCINVIDPNNAAHKQAETAVAYTLVDGSVQIAVSGTPVIGVIESTVIVHKSTNVMVLGTDYSLAFDDDGYLVITALTGGALSATDAITVDFSYLKPSGVVANDIIGTYAAGVYTGIKVVEQVFPALRLVPGFLSALKWNQTPTVAAALQTEAALVSGSFSAMALLDLTTDKGTVSDYSAAPAWKTSNSYTSIYSIPCWPKVKFGDDVFHASTIVACIANLTDAANNGIPFASPSNKTIFCDAPVLDDGTEVLLTKDQANSLNDQGIMTVLNGFNGWRLWGNRTGGYPASTDPKDTFIPVRRMFNWSEATVILTTDASVDTPVNRRLVDLVLSSLESWINGLVALQALDAGKIEFRSDENSTTDLSNGKVTWHLTLTPPSPGQDLEFTVEYDPTALAALFNS